MPDAEIKRRKGLIFRDGLKSSHNDEDCINTLHRTTCGNYQGDYTFVQLLNPAKKIILLIPKKAFCHSNPVPVWGADVPIATFCNPGYVLPEFVVGFVDHDTINGEPANARFEPNLLENRKQYEYKFLEQQRCPFKPHIAR